MTPDTLEPTLCTAYRRERDAYARAVAALRNAEAGSDAWLRVLDAVLAEVAAVEAGIAEAKMSWDRQGRRAGAELRAVLRAVGDEIQALAALVDAARGALEAQRQRLFPLLDATVRQRRMVTAYGERAV